MNAVLAMTFIMLLRTGLISLAIAAFWGIGAYTSATLVMKCGLSFWVSMPAATAVTGITALGVGYMLVRNPGFGFLILTAIINMAVVQIAGNIHYLGGFEGIDGIPPPDPLNLGFIPPVEFLLKIPYYYLILALSVIVVIVYSSFYSAWTAKAWAAIGLNVSLAESLGINAFRYRLLAFVVASATDGLMGSFYAHYMGSITPTAMGIFKTIDIHVYAILGGINFSFAGPIVGSLIMTFIPEFLRITEKIEPILTGCFLILLILLLPGGILSLTKLPQEFRKGILPEDATSAKAE